MKLFGYPYNNDLVIRKDSPDYLGSIGYHTHNNWPDSAGALNRGGGRLGGRNPPEFWMGGGVEHLSTPPDFEKIFIRGGGGRLPLNWSNYIVYVFLST